MFGQEIWGNFGVSEEFLHKTQCSEGDKIGRAGVSNGVPHFDLPAIDVIST